MTADKIQDASSVASSSILHHPFSHLKLLTALAATAAIVVTAFISASVHARNNGKPTPSLVRKEDIKIWDDQYLRGNPKGWTVPPDYHATFGSRRAGVQDRVRYGHFGLSSGWLLYTTWRRLVPLTDAAYAGGENTIYDGHMSNLITPPFELKLDYVTFLISGGYAPNRACINLLVDGEVMRSATGRTNDILEWVAFDVKSLRGKTARIQVLDTSTAATDYITVDCICQSPNSKGAVRVITSPPQAGGNADASAETVSGEHTGKLILIDDGILIGSQEVAFNDLLSLDIGIESPGVISGRRVELVNGDVLKADVLGLEKKKLLIKNEVLGEMRVPVQHIAQAVFMGGESIDSDPHVLVHSGGKRPGKA